MRHFTTPAQWRILKYFWRKQVAFTIDDLMEEGIIHFLALGRFTLRIMEARGQVISLLTRKSGTLYFATTRTIEEWKRIWAPRTFLEKWGDPGFNMRGVNRYEKEEIIAKIDKMLADFCGGIETEGQPGCENSVASKN